jgi:hypothetical protein
MRPHTWAKKMESRMNAMFARNHLTQGTSLQNIVAFMMLCNMHVQEKAALLKAI